jgi:hypothetical protein
VAIRIPQPCLRTLPPPDHRNREYVLVSSRFLGVFSAWLLGTATVTAGCMVAVSELAQHVLDAQGASAISADSDPGASGTHAQTWLPSAVQAGAHLVSGDGSVTATCRSGAAYLLYWKPDPGYRADDVNRGPAAVARVLFSGPGHSVLMRVSCSRSTPVAHMYRASDGGDGGGE